MAPHSTSVRLTLEAAAEVGSGLNGKRRKLLRVLGGPRITAVVVEHRDRFARFGSESGGGLSGIRSAAHRGRPGRDERRSRPRHDRHSHQFLRSAVRARVGAQSRAEYRARLGDRGSLVTATR